MFDSHSPLYSGSPINNNDSLHWLSYVTAYGVTANTTSPPLRHNVADAPFDKTIRIAALATIVICGITGCLLVCGWLWYHRRRPSHVNALIWHLTVSDLLVVTCACLPQLVWEFDRRWTLGLVACKALKFTQSFVIMASNYMLVVLAFDRHRAIRSPLREPAPAWKLTLPGWLTAAVLSIPQLFIFHVNHVPAGSSTMFANMTVCESIFRTTPMWARKAYLTYVGIIVFYIPFSLIAVAYVRIFLKIARRASDRDIIKTVPVSTSRNKSFAISASRSGSLQRPLLGNSNGNIASAHGANSLAASASALTVGQPSGNGSLDQGQGLRPSKSEMLLQPPQPNQHPRQQQRISIQSTHVASFVRAKTKTFKMTVVILAAFVICSLPYHVLEMIYSFGDHSAVPPWLAALLGSTAVANSAVNPYVFLAFSINNQWCCFVAQRCLPWWCLWGKPAATERGKNPGGGGNGVERKGRVGGVGGGVSSMDDGYNTTSTRYSPAVTTCKSYLVSGSGSECQLQRVVTSLVRGAGANNTACAETHIQMQPLSSSAANVHLHSDDEEL